MASKYGSTVHGGPLTLAGTHGSGRIVLTGQSPDYFFVYWPYTRPAVVKFLQNAIDWVTPQPVPTLVEYKIRDVTGSHHPIPPTLRGDAIGTLSAGNLQMFGASPWNIAWADGDFVGRLWKTNDSPGIDPNQYYQFSVHALPGFGFTLTKITYSLYTELYSGMIGPQSFDLYASTDGFSEGSGVFLVSHYIGGLYNRETTFHITDFSALGPGPFKNITFRLYGYNGGQASPSGGLCNSPSISGEGSNLLIEVAPIQMENEPPIADAGPNQVGNEGAPITFDASNSNDPDGDVLQCRWDFDNDGVWDTDWLNHPTITYTWWDDYEGTIRLEVNDGEFTATDDTTAVSVLNVSPTVDAGADVTADEGETITFSGSFTDPGTGDTHTITWDFGDGDSASGILTPTHAYGDDGIYTATLTVVDDDYGVGTDTLTVTVSNVAPTASIDSIGQPNPDFILPGDELTFNGSFTDSGWLDTHTAIWDFGDGTTTPETIANKENEPPDATGTVTGAHTYTIPGEYEVTLEIRDDDDNGTATIIVTVETPAEATETTKDHVEEMAPADFDNPVHQGALLEQLQALLTLQ